MYILIIFLALDARVTSVTAEFSSNVTCLRAADSIVKDAATKLVRANIVSWGCYAK